ncbi:MAG TPA: hypothetical protein VGI45_19930 [Terracidiphilus sp.]|jgi:hypothetical protein
MRRFILFPICFVLLAVPVVVLASGAQGGFNSVVNTIETRYHVHAQRIPFLGFISFVSHKASGDDAVGSLHVAEIDDFHGNVDGDELNNLVTEKLGMGWERVIRETSRKSNNQTLIFMHTEGRRMGLFIVDLDGGEMDVVQVSVDPNHLNESIGKYEHHSHDGDSDKGDRDGESD